MTKEESKQFAAAEEPAKKDNIESLPNLESPSKKSVDEEEGEGEGEGEGGKEDEEDSGSFHL